MKSLYKRFEQAVPAGRQGFTLIELLIVIAVIGVLVAIVILAINPLEQLARGRDANRKTAVAQLGRAMAAYVVNQATATYNIPVGTGWQGPTAPSLQAAGEVSNVIAVPLTPGRGNCPAANAQGNICYNSVAPNTNAVIWTILESTGETGKVTGGAGDCVLNPATAVAAIAWVSSIGRAGTTCIGPAGSSGTALTDTVVLTP